MTTTTLRPIQRVIASQAAPVGTFTVRRALPDHERRSVGPFVFLDHVGPFPVVAGDEGVGPHPHAGIETVTYLLTGRNEHRDSAGHEGIVAAGGAQWMTAGRGIVHAERPLPEAGAEPLVQHGLQLWTSLPRALKMMPPRYQRLDAADIAVAVLPGARLRIIAGEIAGARGPAQTLMPTFLAHASVEPRASLAVEVPASFEAAAYVIAGEGSFGRDAQEAATGELVVFADEPGALSVANAGPEPLEVMLLGGAPAEGPLVFHGPFVMNSLDQVRAAEVAFRTGRMGSLEPIA